MRHVNLTSNSISEAVPAHHPPHAAQVREWRSGPFSLVSIAELLDHGLSGLTDLGKRLFRKGIRVAPIFCNARCHTISTVIFGMAYD